MIKQLQTEFDNYKKNNDGRVLRLEKRIDFFQRQTLRYWISTYYEGKVRTIWNQMVVPHGIRPKLPDFKFEKKEEIAEQANIMVVLAGMEGGKHNDKDDVEALVKQMYFAAFAFGTDVEWERETMLVVADQSATSLNAEFRRRRQAIQGRLEAHGDFLAVTDDHLQGSIGEQVGRFISSISYLSYEAAVNKNGVGKAKTYDEFSKKLEGFTNSELKQALKVEDETKDKRKKAELVAAVLNKYMMI